MSHNDRINSPLRAPLITPFHYGWLVLGLSFLSTLTAAGIRSAPAVLIHPFEVEFGWSRAAIASAISINLLLYGVAGPVSGWLLDRFGARRVMIGSLCLLLITLGATTLMTEFWQLVLLWGVVIGLGAGGVGSVLSATVANHWFKKRRGLALGIVNSAGSTGQMIFLPLLMTLIVSIGWRLGTLVMVAVLAVLLPFVFFWMRDDPADIGLTPYGADEGGSGEAGGDGALRAVSPGEGSISVVNVFRSTNFWLLAGSFFVCGGTSMGLISVHLVPYSIDRGIPQGTAAPMMGIMGGLNFVGSFLSGWVIDRVEPRKWLALVYALRGVSLLILPSVTNSLGLFAFAVIYGLDWFATVAPTVALTADCFGVKAVGRVYGWIFLAHQIGAALMASGAGFLRVYFGDYESAFLLGCVLAMLAAILALKICPRKE